MEKSSSSAAADTVFEVSLSFKGKSCKISLSERTTGIELDEIVRSTLFVSDGDNDYANVSLKLLHKGKVLDNSSAMPLFPSGLVSQKPPKIMVMATSKNVQNDISSRKSDPTIRGFDNEKQKIEAAKSSRIVMHWGPGMVQNKNYKFCRFEACTWQSFGHRTGSKTPHAFRAMQLLEKLSTDPGVVAIMVERKLVVGTLGEMDPIDDRLMQKKKTEGACLLGYNTNAGGRIDLKLRTDDLQHFLPYEQLASTLIHELSHNWVGEHNALFWGNFAQMRVEYLQKHAWLRASGYVVDGKTTATIARIADHCVEGMRSISNAVIQECSKEMAPHGLSVDLITPAILDRCRELAAESEKSKDGQRLGGGNVSAGDDSAPVNGGLSSRELALAAAERRAKEAKSDAHTCDKCGKGGKYSSLDK